MSKRRTLRELKAGNFYQASIYAWNAYRERHQRAWRLLRNGPPPCGLYQHGLPRSGASGVMRFAWRGSSCGRSQVLVGMRHRRQARTRVREMVPSTHSPVWTLSPVPISGT